MAIIRAVKRNSESGMWGYIEYSDEDPKRTIHMVGPREFAEEQDAIDYSKGFAPDSYEYVEPMELKKERLLKSLEMHKEAYNKVCEELKEFDVIVIPISQKRRGFQWNNPSFQNEYMNNPSREFDWNGYMAMMEYEKICRTYYDRPFLPSLPPKKPHRMIDFATKYKTTIASMKTHERKVEDDLKRDKVDI